MHKTGETVTVQFCVSDPATAGIVDADALPTGKLVLNGVDNAATVTVTNISTGLYRAAVTLPTLVDGDELQIRINATVATVAGAGIVWQGEGCTKRPADLVVPDPAGTGAAIVSALSGIPLDATETQAAAAAAITAAGLPSGKTGYSLAATGLDAIADPDDLTPATVPTTFTQKLRWLIQRFWKAEKTATTIVVKNEAGQTITTQAITSGGSDQTTGAPS